MHFSPQDSTTSMIGRSRHSLSKMLPLNPRIGRYTYILLHLLAHPGRGHTNYSTKPEPILACGCTRKLLDMRIRLISLSLGGRTTSGAPPWISHACSHCTSPPFKPNTAQVVHLQVLVLITTLSAMFASQTTSTFSEAKINLHGGDKDV